MAFRFPKEARGYFKAIMSDRGGQRQNMFNMFDIYYYCLLMGLAINKIDTDESLLGDEFQKGYPDQFKENKDFLTALLISSELKRNNTRKDDKSFQTIMLQMINVNEASQLSAIGYQRMNEYALKGFIEIKENMPFEPITREDFLASFYDLLNSKTRSEGNE